MSKPKPDAFGNRPLNILLLGSDGRDDPENCKLGGACESGGARADVQMLLHVAADRSNASVVTIPRDTRVPIAACTDPETGQRYEAMDDTINAALAHGGPGCVVTTWQNLTKVYIDHFIMVDFSGVVSMADAIGGVEVCVQQNVFDEQNYVDKAGVRHSTGSHLKLEAGTTRIQGEQALQWLRTRHAFEYGSDVGRVKAQHMYINSMIRTLKQASTLADPRKVLPLAEAATKAVHVDDGLGSLTRLIDLAGELNKLPTNRITMTTMPKVEDPENKDHLIPAPSAERVWAMLRADTAFDKNGGPPKTDPATPAPPPVDKATVEIVVQNGTTLRNRAGTVAQELVRKGFTRAVKSKEVPPAADTTRIDHPAGAQAAAQAVAGVLGLPAVALHETPEVTRSTVVIGADWPTGATFGKPATAKPSVAPTAGDLPDSADALNASDDKACMAINQEKNSQGRLIYSW